MGHMGHTNLVLAHIATSEEGSGICVPCVPFHIPLTYDHANRSWNAHPSPSNLRGGRAGQGGIRLYGGVFQGGYSNGWGGMV